MKDYTIDPEEARVFFHRSINLQVLKAFKMALGNDYKLCFTLDNYLIPRIRSGETTHWEAMTHCINKKIPIMVRTDALGTMYSRIKFFIFSGYDDLYNNHTEVIIYALEKNRYTLCFKVPVDVLELDLDFKYRELIDVTMYPM
jgi:hypothetical protein